MAVQGVKFDPPKSTIISILKDSKGVITTASKKLDVAPHTLRLHIKKDPELVELLDNLRNNFEDNLLDMAENTVLYALSKRDEDPNNAIKSAFFVLNSKGQNRGWSNTLQDVNKNQKIVFEVNYPDKNPNDSIAVSHQALSTPDPTEA